MNLLTKMLFAVYEDAYLQGRQDGIEGLHIAPQLALENYLNDELIWSKLQKLGLYDGSQIFH